MKRTLIFHLIFIVLIFRTGEVFSSVQTGRYCKSFYSKTMKQPYQQQQSFWVENSYNFQVNLARAPIFSKLEYPYQAPIVSYQPRSSYKIKETRNIDQGTSKECFIFAFIGGLESTFMNHQGRSIQLYPEYLIAEKLKYTIQGLLEFGEGSTYYNLEGGEFFHAVNLARASGVIPVGANWEPLRKVTEWPFDYIYAQIRQQTIEAKNAINNSNFSYDEKQKLIVQKTDEIFSKVLGPYVGFLPNSFYYQGSSYTALSFAQSALKNLNFLTESVFYLNQRGEFFPKSPGKSVIQGMESGLRDQKQRPSQST